LKETANKRDFYMIIDFHTHIYPEKIAAHGVKYIGDFYGFSLDADRGTKAHLDACCAAAGVDYKVHLAVAVRPEQVQSINNWLSSVLDAHSFGFGSLHPQMEDPLAELDRFEALGFSGVKFHPDMQSFAADDPSMFPVYEKIAGRYPVLFHAGDKRYDFSGPRRIARVLDAFPNLTVIAAHLGGYSEWEEAMELLCGRDVYFDTSSAVGFLPEEKAVEMIRSHRPDRLLFGTDYPVVTQEEELKTFRALGLDRELEERILWKNAAALLHIQEK
jgi:predicted TIM-barrel fold metal-dependent hydrolase